MKYHVVVRGIGDIDAKQINPSINDVFNITLHFKSFDSKYGAWTVSVDEENVSSDQDQGFPPRNLNDTIYLADQNMSIFADKDSPYSVLNRQSFAVPNIYGDALGAVIIWFSKPAKDISADSSVCAYQSCDWRYHVIGIENTTTPAGTFSNTTVLALYGPNQIGKFTSTAYIDKDSPFPIKGSILSRSGCGINIGQVNGTCSANISDYELIGYRNIASNGSELTTKSITWNDHSYEIRYSMVNGTVSSANATRGNLHLFLNDTGQGAGLLTLELPLHLVKPLLGNGSDSESVGEQLAVFVYDIDTTNFVTESTCDTLTIKIPTDLGSGQVTVVGSDGIMGEYPAPAPTDVANVSPTLQVDNKQFRLNTLTNADSCSFSLDTGTKTLHVAIRNPAFKSGYMKITLPHELLGGNYTVLADGEPFSNYTILADNSNRTTIVTWYSPKVASLDIVGTSVVPEFPSIQAGFASLAAIFSVIIGVRRTRHS
ncbi:MAG: hypothetical protein ABI361_11135 [Nitrososphaera sp.]